MAACSQRRALSIAATIIALLLATCCHAAMGQLLHPDDCEALREWPEVAKELGLSKCNPRPECSTLPPNITCNEDGRVTELELLSTNISGTLPDNWSRMTTLEYMDFSGTNVSGTLPDSWSSMTALEYMYLSSTNVSGTLPDSWSNMTSLKFMGLSSTNISGTLPESWRRMPHLKELFLSSTNVHGTLPDSWSIMPNLTTLELLSTNISGTLPDNWSRMTTLQYMDLSSTKVSGTLPNSWSMMTNLINLYLSRTNVSGTLPDSWSNMTSLKFMELFNTNASGALPDSWGRMTTLEYMDLSGANVSGTLPDSWSMMTNLINLYISGTNVNGTLPASWSNMTSLKYMELLSTNISGTLPDNWSRMTTLQYMDLSSTDVSGTLPNSWSMMTNLTYLYLSSTNVHGTLPSSWSIMPNLTTLDLSSTNISGTLPDSWSTLPYLKDLYLSNTSISGILQDSWSKMPNLYILKLSSTNISGTLPNILMRTKNIFALDLSSTNISGTLPESWSRMPVLAELKLSSTNISGTLPNSWSMMTNLTTLDLSNNNIKGTIPGSWGQPFVYLNLSNNILEGTVPALGNKCLVWDVANNRLTGTLPQLTKTSMILLSASNNSLQGTIPALPDTLVYLQLSSNTLTGAIPDVPATSSMRAMALDDNKLEHLPNVLSAPNATYLSAAGNMLQGSLPTGYNHSLDFCDLSSNMLSGSVPVKSWSEKSWLYLALDNNSLSGTLPSEWLGEVGILLLQNNNITGCLPALWMNNNTLQVLSLSNNSMQCTDGLPHLWGRADTFSKLKVVALDGNGDLAQIPTTWLTTSHSRGTRLLMGEEWMVSADNRKWRRDVCILKGINAILSSQLNIVSLEADVLRDVRQQLQARFATLADEIGERLMEELRRQILELDGRYIGINATAIKAPELAVSQVKLHLTNATHPSLKRICGNRDAKVVVALLWGTCGSLVLLLALVYVVEVKWKLVTAICLVLQRSWYRFLDRRGTSSGHGSGGFARIVSVAKALAFVLGMLLYWADIVIDIVLLQQVWAVGSGLKWGLLFILLLHYITAMCVVCWRWTHGQGMWQQLVNTLLSMFLVPVLPLVDTVVFCILAYNHFMQRPIDNCPKWLQRLFPSLLTFQALFHMRDTLEVLLEAVPTAAVQAVVFVVGNTPRLGIYLDTWLYTASGVGSCIQMLRLLATVLWTAWEQDVSPWGALVDRLLWRSTRLPESLTCPHVLKDTEDTTAYGVLF